MLHYIVSYHEVSRFILHRILAHYVMSHELRLIERLNSNNCAVTALEKAREWRGREGQGRAGKGREGQGLLLDQLNRNQCVRSE
jgi:hypothetical protein